MVATTRAPVTLARVLLCLIACTALAPAAAQNIPPTAAGQEPLACASVELFHREGCPFCERAHEFLDQLQLEYPALQVARFDVRAP